MSALRDEFLARVYSGKSKDFDPEIFAKTSEQLKSAMFDGYGATFSEVDASGKDFEMLNNLERNVYQFSAAKNYQELQQLTQLLTDESGQLRPFNDFRAEAEKVFKSFNEDYLSTEYGTAVNSAMQASRWADYTKNSKAMPYLRYVTAGDSRVRDSHKSLDGVIKRIDDVFWNSYYPPNGYNCRCTTTQTGQSKETAESAITYPSVNPMFKTNLAKQGLIFPKDHPYYNDIPKDAIRRALSYIPPENAFRTIKFEGTTLQEHALIDDTADVIHKNRQCAKILIDNGYRNVKLLPKIHQKDIELRELYYGKEYQESNRVSSPDALVDGHIIEFKQCTLKMMGKRITQAARQSDRCFIFSKDQVKQDYLDYHINRQWGRKETKNLVEIIVVNKDGSLKKYLRP